MQHSKQAMSNLDYFFVLKELQTLLEGARLDGAYDYFGGFRLRFRKQGTLHNLAIELGVRLHLTAKLPHSPSEPSSFVKLLREKLGNEVLEKIGQLNFDRIVSLNFSRGGKLVFEQLGKGNALLLDETGKIVRPMRGEEFSSRKLRKGEQYSPPPNERLHPLQLNNLLLANPCEKAVAALSKTVNLAPFYLEEAVARTGREKGALVGEVEARKVLEECKQLVNEQAAPLVYFDEEGKPAFFAPFHLNKLEGERLVAKKFPSFSEALDEYYSGHFEGQAVARGTAKVEGERAKLRGALEQQKKALEKMVVEERGAREAAEWIYSNYQAVEEILLHAREAQNRKTGDEEMSRELSQRLGKKIVLRKGIVEILDYLDKEGN